MSLTSYQAAPPRNLDFLCDLLFGGAGGNRTHNPQIRSLMLYPIELQPQIKPAASYSRTGGSRTTLGDGALNFSVRNGNWCDNPSMATGMKTVRVGNSRELQS